MAAETILHLDTTTARLHLALSRNGEVLVEVCQPCQSHRYHSAVIVPAIQALLQQADLTPQCLTALAVNLGPGSFTGIRTGIITARTLAQFLKIPVYTFNAFELLAFEADAPVSVYIDALRSRAYMATLSFRANGPVYLQTPILKLLESGEMSGSASTLLIAETLRPLFGSDCSPQLISEAFSPVQPMLSLIARYGQRFQQRWDAVKPLYVQEPSITLKSKPSKGLV
ncbi:tRNA (adenosine(37)-N6)-threonylcarbamoyltransferase complex dimerization subunit type 1 TsaB [Vampirovibrio sp.]|uniref:tRNA (adenosine(37)-N6)-threonylcarbamoyltransferase complex dimerization subunit type 1 TsaB n=1 Tax=Vampirovibrio sp. TaxID=2717857 RepID=UPI0035937FD9